MIIASLHLGHNATASIHKDGELIGILGQEKLNNIKNSASAPLPALIRLLEELEIPKRDISAIAVCGTEIYPSFCYDYMFESKPKEYSGTADKIERVKRLYRKLTGSSSPPIVRQIRKARLLRKGKDELHSLLREYGFENVPLEFIDHHTCHAFSSYYGLSDDHQAPALVFTADGSGDSLSSTVSIARNGTVERIDETPAKASLGAIYSGTTRFLGMKILEHEYKVMGLAAYSKGYEKEVYRKVFSPVIWLNSGQSLSFSSEFDTSTFYDYLCKSAVGERFDNVAAAAQMLIEERVCEWIEKAVRQTGIRNVYTSGGLFMNVKLNKKIQEIPSINKVQFMPSCGDESNPVGAGFACSLRNSIKPKPFNNLYLGVSSTKEELDELIDFVSRSSDYEVNEYLDIDTVTAELLAEKKVVARFTGRCEWGARSLGNRAILAHPGFMESFYMVNDQIKCRDFWMPFAPSILEEDASLYLENYEESRNIPYFMITAYDATNKAKEHLKAAIHQGDHTLRPQLVNKASNTRYHQLISRFKEISGIGAVLNTSLNLHGYPLVATPAQAFSCLDKSGLRHLAIENYLIVKK